MKFINIVFHVVLICLCMAAARAEVSDPEIDFIDTAEEISIDYGIVKNDEVIRLELDLNGDGKPTIFLAYKGSGSKGGINWTAYTPVESGYARVNGIQFREDFVRAGKVEGISPDGGLLALYPGKGAGSLVHYMINEREVIQREVKVLDYSSPEDRTLFARIFERQIDEPMPHGFYKNPPHQVIEVKSIDARRTAPSPGRQLERRETKRPNADQIESGLMTKEPKSPMSDSNPAGPKKVAWLWLPITTLIVGVAGLLWFFFKRRSH